ncbi:MAG: hypothetical protein IJ016_02485 [Elusimicrobiaceae bacterium]|nr:hypothetical protein [Elusimicrobiaceae bacterium]
MSNKVFFLGAGFSKAINSNYPLMDELTRQVFERLGKESVKEHLREIMNLAERESDFEQQERVWKLI